MGAFVNPLKFKQRAVNFTSYSYLNNERHASQAALMFNKNRYSSSLEIIEGRSAFLDFGILQVQGIWYNIHHRSARFYKPHKQEPDQYSENARVHNHIL